MEKKKPKKLRLPKRFDFKPVNKRARRMEKASLKHAHTFIVTRFANLRSIRRHIIGWFLLMGILIGLTSLQLSLEIMSTSTPKPADGGTYAEGLVDSISTLNPLFSTTQAEQSANKLIFSGLLKYDNQGILQPDLAESWEVNKDSTQYAFTLRPHLMWHDGQKLTANDVVATVNAMQDPRIGALAQASWRGIKVKALNEHQVVFTLPGAYAPFASAATFAILPQHLLNKIPPESLRESSFSKNPIGSGPFRFVDFKSVDITGGRSALQLESFTNYWAGQPRLGRFLLYTYSQPNDLLKGLGSHEINAASNVSLSDIKKLDSTELNIYRVPLNSAVYALFKTDSETLKDIKIRQALVQGIDITDLRLQLGAKALDNPVINNQLPQATQIKQKPFDKKAAELLLKESGWVKNKKTGYQEKNGNPLELRLVTVDAGNYRKLATILSEKWAGLGIKIDTQVVDPQQVQQSVLRPRSYDILVYELEQGGDADSYAYWHSSQAIGAGLNLADYSSPLVDDALITARIRTNPQLRDAKYATFARQWVSDAPALSLYQPTLNYLTARNVQSVGRGDHLPIPSDRFSNVNEWTAQTKLTSTSP